MLPGSVLYLHDAQYLQVDVRTYDALRLEYNSRVSFCVNFSILFDFFFFLCLFYSVDLLSVNALQHLVQCLVS